MEVAAMITTITPVISMHDKVGQKQYLYVFTLPTVPISSTSEELKLDQLPKHGRIDQLNISCASTDFDLSVRDKASATEDTVNEIIDYDTTNKSYEKTDVKLEYDNADSPTVNALYCKIKNDDAGNATGEITLKLHVTDLR
jgi:hypothetical protein